MAPFVGRAISDRISRGLTRRGVWGALLSLGAGLILSESASQAQFIYVANGGGSNDVSAYQITAEGTLLQIAGSPFPAGNLPASVAIDPKHRFAYVVNESSNNISAYAIGAKGELSSVPGSPFDAGTNPHEVAVDPQGRFAYVVNAVDNNVSGYQIDANSGALAPIDWLAISCGKLPAFGGCRSRRSGSLTWQTKSATTSPYFGSMRVAP